MSTTEYNKEVHRIGDTIPMPYPIQMPHYAEKHDEKNTLFVVLFILILFGIFGFGLFKHGEKHDHCDNHSRKDIDVNLRDTNNIEMKIIEQSEKTRTLIEFNNSQNLQNKILEQSQEIQVLRSEIFTGGLFGKMEQAMHKLDNKIDGVACKMVKQPTFIPCGENHCKKED